MRSLCVFFCWSLHYDCVLLRLFMRNKALYCKNDVGSTVHGGSNTSVASCVLI